MKIKIVLLATIVISLLVYLNWSFFEEGQYFDIGDLSQMHKKGFSEVFITAGDKRLSLSKFEIDDLMKKISEMNPSKGSGLKGGKWSFHCSLNFRIPSDHRTYRLRFVSRSTMIGVQAKAQIRTSEKLLSFQSYRGDKVLKYIDDIAIRKIGRVKRTGKRRSLCSPEPMRHHALDY